MIIISWHTFEFAVKMMMQCSAILTNLQVLAFQLALMANNAVQLMNCHVMDSYRCDALINPKIDPCFSI